jgi:AcrR family transcriptional regulator
MNSDNAARIKSGRTGREPLSKTRIVDAAMAIVDTDGLDALSMRRLGSDLGVDPMAIYRHVNGRDGVLDGLAERMWSEASVIADGTDWHDQLRLFARGIRGIFHTHPNAAPLLLQRFVVPLPLLEAVHVQLCALYAVGFEARRAHQIVRTVQSFSLGYGLAEISCFGITDAGTSDLSTEAMLVLLGQALPPDTPPHLVDAAIALYGEADPDALFESGLDLLLNGLSPS